MQNKFYGWNVLIALWFVVFVNQAFTTFGASVISGPMARALGFDRSTLGLALTVFTLANGLSAPLVAWTVNKFGTRLTITYASVYLATACLIVGRYTSVGWQYAVEYGLGVGVGVAFATFVPCQNCVTQWFLKRRGVAMSLVLTATGVGGVVAAPLLAHIMLAADGNWRVGWYCIAAAVCGAGIIAFLFVKNRPGDYGQIQDGVRADEMPRLGERGAVRAGIYHSTISWTVRGALKTRSLWIILGGSVGFYMAITVFLAHGVRHLTDIGHTPAEAGLATGTVALFSIIGKLLAGFLCDRFEPRYVWAVCMALTAGGMGLMISATSPADIYMFAIPFGGGFGGCLVCWPTIMANYFGAGSFASLMGFNLPLQTIFTSVAPLLVGVVADSRHSYTLPFIGVAAITLSMGLLLLFATPPRADTDRKVMAIPRGASTAGVTTSGMSLRHT
jgi:MFS family permease